jgi:hypothetical protein
MATALATGQWFAKNSSERGRRQLVRATEQRRDDVFSDRRDEHQQRAGDDAGRTVAG